MTGFKPSDPRPVGLFGGAFDPIHFGHLNLAVALWETERFSKIIFCPAACSPFKLEAPPAVSGEQRVEMVRLALASYPYFQVSDLEIKRPPPSYSIDTVRALQLRGPLRLLLSEESAAYLHLWKEAELLFQVAPPMVGSFLCSDRRRLNNENIQYECVTIPHLEISSTRVRQRLCAQKPCWHLVPKEVLEYISMHNLYN